MIWLIFVIPILLLIGVGIYIDKKNKGMNHPPDVNRGNHNIETETTKHQFYNSGGGGNDGGGFS